MESSNFNVLNLDSNNLAEVVGQCQLVIVVLSLEYLTSIQFKVELGTILKSRRANNRAANVYFVFHDLTQSELQWAFDRTLESPIDLSNEALRDLLEKEKVQLKRTEALIVQLKEGRIAFEKFYKLFSEVLREMWIIDGV